ncbi:MAG: hypothetical protein K2X91_18025, partial [Thermoleophilia bacterium]|nr:hypothetical protein [Thermoleophilia bacterium]
ILGVGQYRLDAAAFASVSAIDDRVQEAADAGDAERFDRELRELVAEITRLGTPLAADEFEGSDAIVPGAGTTLEEARALLTSEGLIPG